MNTGKHTMPAGVVVPDCFLQLHKEIGARHFGRMPKEVQEAFDACNAVIEANKVRANYTAPPVPSVPALKLPDVLTPYPSNDIKELAHNAGWNACLAEFKRLNGVKE